MSRREEAEQVGRAPAATPGSPAFRPHREKRREEVGRAGELIASGRLQVGGKAISAGVITGGISSLTADPRQPGEYIDIKISWSASNPKGGSMLDPWKIFIIAKDSTGNKEVVKTARVTNPSIQDTDTLRLWQMPDTPIALEVRLYAHQKMVDWDWSWWPEVTPL